METYVIFNSDNSIQAAADWPAPGMVEVDYEVVYGYDGQLYRKGTEPVKPAEEAEDEAFSDLRAMRDQMLAECDWTVLPDSPLPVEKQDSWKAYRQALRDLPAQPGAPWADDSIPWPAKPE